MALPEGISEQNLMAYIDQLASVLGHADRHEPMRAYLEGLFLPGERKSIEPMAARVDPRRVQARHQSMHHFVAKAPWDAQAVIRAAREYALAEFEHHGGVECWIIDDTAFPKKGTHSVGVARQYCGVLGKQENCQVAVSVSLANELMSVPAAFRLYLPESWTSDPDRRRAAGVPDEIEFATKWQIALAQVDDLLAAGVSRAPITMDAGYGRATEFRDELEKRGLEYIAAVPGEITVWPPGKKPLALERSQPLEGAARALRGRAPGHQPVRIDVLAKKLPKSAWRTVWWRQGTRGDMRSRFALLRVRVAHKDYWRPEPRPLQWLLLEWLDGESEPTKFWLSNLPTGTRISRFVHLAHMRWRIERDYEELKSELGLDHYEGRGWLGFHHHAALCIAAYAFLIAERARLSPPQPLAFLKAAPLPRGFRPRGSPATT
jgi:SRSO17 transposase